MEIAKVKTAVQGVLSILFAPARIVDVAVEEAVDSDGDPILNVKVVYDSRAPAPSADNLFTATTAVRLSLRLDGEQRFPLLSIISSDDAQGVAA